MDPMDRQQIHNQRYDVIIVGGGHAGAEAAWAASGVGMSTKNGLSVCLVTMEPDNIGAMSCNPAIGGLAKGQIVREVDALGGIMGRAIDATGIQFRVLNTSRGAAVHGPRAQADKYQYAHEIQRLLSTRPIDIVSGTVERLIVRNGQCCGIYVDYGDGVEVEIFAKAVVLTTGTFMRGLMHTGHQQTTGGRVDEAGAHGISDYLQSLGFEIGRLKTGTPPRLASETINFDVLSPQLGDINPRPFSEMTDLVSDNGEAAFPEQPQIQCYTTHTNQQIHDLISENLSRAPMYSGQIEADVGPRYCPSIEDKVVRFADRSAHHVFLEPESLGTNEVYCNGISTSLPCDVQDRIVQLMQGCEQAKIIQYGYAVEYDMVWPHQIDSTGMTKLIPGLFLAGQINGTSGYEEAAGQGLLTGLNAARYVYKMEPIRLGRDNSYIGVMMDDLVTKTPREPYRMFTSRAEYRLMLRADNAPDRLTEFGREIGLICDDRWDRYLIRKRLLYEIHGVLQTAKNDAGKRLDWCARQSNACVDDIAPYVKAAVAFPDGQMHHLIEVAFNNIRYKAYVERQCTEAARMREMDHRPIPLDLDYDSIVGFRGEALEMMKRFQPQTVGQAGRMAGINPADLTVLIVAIEKYHREQRARKK